jgi:hypothetical protein
MGADVHKRMIDQQAHLVAPGNHPAHAAQSVNRLDGIVIELGSRTTTMSGSSAAKTWLGHRDAPLRTPPAITMPFLMNARRVIFMTLKPR